MPYHQPDYRAAQRAPPPPGFHRVTGRNWINPSDPRRGDWIERPHRGPYYENPDVYRAMQQSADDLYVPLREGDGGWQRGGFSGVNPHRTSESTSSPPEGASLSWNLRTPERNPRNPLGEQFVVPELEKGDRNFNKMKAGGFLFNRLFVIMEKNGRAGDLLRPFHTCLVAGHCPPGIHIAQCRRRGDSCMWWGIPQGPCPHFLRTGHCPFMYKHRNAKTRAEKSKCPACPFLHVVLVGYTQGTRCDERTLALLCPPGKEHLEWLLEDAHQRYLDASANSKMRWQLSNARVQAREQDVAMRDDGYATARARHVAANATLSNFSSEIDASMRSELNGRRDRRSGAVALGDLLDATNGALEAEERASKSALAAAELRSRRALDVQDFHDRNKEQGRQRYVARKEETRKQRSAKDEQSEENELDELDASADDAELDDLDQEEDCLSNVSDLDDVSPTSLDRSAKAQHPQATPASANRRTAAVAPADKPSAAKRSAAKPSATEASADKPSTAKRSAAKPSPAKTGTAQPAAKPPMRKKRNHDDDGLEVEGAIEADAAALEAATAKKPKTKKSKTSADGTPATAKKARAKKTKASAEEEARTAYERHVEAMRLEQEEEARKLKEEETRQLKEEQEHLTLDVTKVFTLDFAQMAERDPWEARSLIMHQHGLINKGHREMLNPAVLRKEFIQLCFENPLGTLEILEESDEDLTKACDAQEEEMNSPEFLEDDNPQEGHDGADEEDEEEDDDGINWDAQAAALHSYDSDDVSPEDAFADLPPAPGSDWKVFDDQSAKPTQAARQPSTGNSDNNPADTTTKAAEAEEAASFSDIPPLASM